MTPSENNNYAPIPSGGGGCGGCPVSSSPSPCSCSGSSGTSSDEASDTPSGGRSSPSIHVNSTNRSTPSDEKITRREALKTMGRGAVAAGGMTAGLGSLGGCGNGHDNRAANDAAFFEENYRLMTEQEKQRRIQRLEERYEREHNVRTSISGKEAIPGVLYGYAFNIATCEGYRECVRGCIQENNLDRNSDMQYIRIFEKGNGQNMNLEGGNPNYHHQVPAEGHFYIGTQCYQCENPPCVEVCPVGATWKEPDGIVVVDYDWCIGCRYCQAACPYWARRFNWDEPQVPRDEINTDQHYLGNRIRPQGVMEKCTFCIQRSRDGQLPACVEACPTGARVFGNLLDPDSEIRYVLENKNVFRLKEDLNTDPKFWYYVD